MIFGDLALARRLEAFEADNGRENVLAAKGDGLEIADGYAAFTGVNSPLSHAMGLGMNGPVTAAQLDELELFYRSRGAAVTVDLCPLSDPSLMELVGARGYRIVEFNNMLVRRTGEPPPEAGIEVREARPEEAGLWANTVASGFFEHDPTPPEIDLGGSIWPMRSARCYLAWIGGGEPAGAAVLLLRDGLAGLFGDATLPQMRRRGVHTALIAERLRAAASLGYDLAFASTLPGSGSQRNYQKSGFEVVYTKFIMSR